MILVVTCNSLALVLWGVQSGVPFLNFLKLRLCRPKGLGEWTTQGLPLHSELLGRIDRFEPQSCWNNHLAKCGDEDVFSKGSFVEGDYAVNYTAFYFMATWHIIRFWFSWFFLMTPSQSFATRGNWCSARSQLLVGSVPSRSIVLSFGGHSWQSLLRREKCCHPMTCAFKLVNSTLHVSTEATVESLKLSHRGRRSGICQNILAKAFPLPCSHTNHKTTHISWLERRRQLGHLQQSYAWRLASAHQW